MSILTHNGGTVLAMTGKNCVAIASDKRLGEGFSTQSFNCVKIHEMNDKIMVGLAGLNSDTITVRQDLEYKMKLFELREDRQMPVDMFRVMLGKVLYKARFGPWFTEPVVAGLNEKNEPMITCYDLIGCDSPAPDFCVSGTATDQLFGVCESFWKPDMDEEELFECISQSMLSALDRDCMSGWGAVVKIMTPDKIITRHLKGRMD